MQPSDKIIGFVATQDSERARSFYEGVLGLRFVSHDQFALVLDSNGTMIRIAKVPDFTPRPFTVLGWEVKDIATAVRALHEKGVSFERYGWFQQDELGIWTTPTGEKVAWFKDPDGNLLSLSQHLAAPEA